MKIASDFAGQTEDGVEIARDAVGVDIVFHDAAGAKLDVADDVKVSIDISDYRELRIEDKYVSPSYDVIHVPEEGEPEVIETEEADEEGVVFKADEFSPYVIMLSPVNFAKLGASPLSGYSDYSPYMTSHSLEVDGNALSDGDTIEPSVGFSLKLQFSTTISDMADNIGTSDGLHYYYVLPDHISIGDQGSADNPISLYNSKQIEIGTYFIKDDVMYITFPGFYDEVATYFELSATWSDTEDRDSIDVNWGTSVDKYLINRTSLIITKSQTEPLRNDDGITFKNYKVTLKPKTDDGSVTDVIFDDTFTAKYMEIKQDTFSDGGADYAYKVTSFDYNGKVVDTKYFSFADTTTVSPSADGNRKDSKIHIEGLRVEEGGKTTVEYTTYIPRESKRDMDNTKSEEVMDNEAVASHPVYNPTTGEYDYPTISTKVTDSIIYKNQMLFKDANDDSMTMVQAGDNEMVSMEFSANVNPLREYTMGGAVFRDKLTGWKTQTLDENVIYDLDNLTGVEPYLVKTTGKDTSSTNTMKWVVLDNATYAELSNFVNQTDILSTLEKLRANDALEAKLISAAGESGSVYTDAMASTYIFTNQDAHDFIWIIPMDADPDKPASYNIHYYTLSGKKIATYANSAALSYKEMVPIVFGAIGEPGPYILPQREIVSTKSNAGVYLGSDGNFYVDWTITVALPADSAGWPDIAVMDQLPAYTYHDKNGNEVVYSDWLCGIAAPTYNEYNNGNAFNITTTSDRADVQAITKRARVGLRHPLWSGYSKVFTSEYNGAFFVEKPDSEWIDFISKWNSEAFNAAAVSSATVYSDDEITAGQFVADIDGTDWVGKLKTGQTGTVREYAIWLGDFPSTQGTDGYSIEINYTTQVNPRLVELRNDILTELGTDRLTLTNNAYLYRSKVEREDDGTLRGYSYQQMWLENGPSPNPNSGYIGIMPSSYWIGGGDPTTYITKDRTKDYDSSTGLVHYQSNVNPDNTVYATQNKYVIQDTMSVTGILFKNITLTFPDSAGKTGNDKYIIRNGVINTAYTDYVGLEVTNNADSSNTFKITLDNKDKLFQGADNKFYKLKLDYDADFKTNQIPTDVTLNNTILLSMKVSSSDGTSESTSILDQDVDEYTVDKALEKKRDKTVVPSESNDYTARYTINIDPESENAHELADLSAGDYFTIKDTMKTANMELSIDSVIVEEISSDASHTVTDITDNCLKKYDTYNRVLEIEVPVTDPKAKYVVTYDVILNHVSRESFEETDNQVEILGTKIKMDRVHERVRLSARDESSDAVTYQINLIKYDMDDIEKRVDATFDLYVRDGDRWKNLTSGDSKIAEPLKTVDGQLQIRNSIVSEVPINLIEKYKWYKLVEISADTPGYSLNTKPLYYFVSDNGQVQEKYTNDKGEKLYRDVYIPGDIDDYKIVTLKNTSAGAKAPELYFGNRKGGFDLKKVDKSTTTTVIPGVDFELYKDSAMTELVGAETTDSDGMIHYLGLDFTDGEATYYLKETSTPDGYKENNNVYELVFRDYRLTGAVNVDDRSDSLKVENGENINTLIFPNESEENKLVVKKVVESKEDIVKATSAFTFNITITDETGKIVTAPFDAKLTNEDGSLDRSITSVTSQKFLTIKSGQTLEIQKIPDNYKYEVREMKDRNFKTRVTVEDNAGSDSITNQNVSVVNGTVEPGSGDIVTFINTHKTSIKVYKKASTNDGTVLNIPDGHTITLRSGNLYTGKIWAVGEYNASTGKYEQKFVADQDTVFTTKDELGQEMQGGFRVYGIDSTGLAVIESNADIDGYVYNLKGHDSYSANAFWTPEDKENRNVTLYNIYSTDFAEKNVSINKTLLGRDLRDGEFSFSIYKFYDGSYKTQVETGVKNKADGTVDFSTLKFTLSDIPKDATEADVYYRISEDGGNLPNVVYDTSKSIYVKIHLTKSVDAGTGEVTLEASDPVYSSTDLRDDANVPDNDKEIVNTYSAAGSIKLRGSKTMKSKDAAADTFSFEVYEYTDSDFTTRKSSTPVATAVSPAVAKDGTETFEFSQIDYSITLDNSTGTVTSDVGTHYYQVEEVIPADKKGIIYDDTKQKIAVVVKDNATGNLTATVKEVNDDGSIGATVTNVAEKLNFENDYDADGSLDVKIVKTLNGRSAEEDEFGFTMTEYTDDTYTDVKKDANDQDIVYKVRNIAAGSGAPAEIAFDTINYKFKDVGDHYYKIVEDQPTGRGVTTKDNKKKKAGVIYDNAEYEVVATVSDNGNGTLNAVLKDKNGVDITTVGGAIEFINTYEASGDIQFTGNKILEGHDIVNNSDGWGFCFYLYDITGGSNELMSNLYTTQPASVDPATGTAAAPIDFVNIHYELGDVGLHQYMVFEAAPAGYDTEVEGITYDDHAYRITVDVKDGGNGKLSAETTKVERIKYNSSVVEELPVDADIDFTNTYFAETSMIIRATKSMNAGAKTLADSDTFHFELREVVGDTEHILAKGRNNENGEIIFFDGDDPTHEFELYYQIDGKDDVYPAYRLGEHHYKIAEVNDEAAGYIYDETVYSFTLNVTDNFDGTIHIDSVDGNPERVDAAEDAEHDSRIFVLNPAEDKEATFENSYEAFGDITFSGIKTLEGYVTENTRDIVDGEFTYTVTEYTDDTYETEKGMPVYTGAARADGIIEYETITYERSAETDDVGTHYYKITEDVPEGAELTGDGNYVYQGVTYSDTVYYVTVNVSDNNDGTLDVKASDIYAELDFTNYYEAYGKTSVRIEKQTLDINDEVYTGVDSMLSDYEFSFILSEVFTDENGEETEEVLEEVTTGLNGVADFTDPEYDLDDLGEHIYRITEREGDLEGFTYDETVNEIVVLVTDNGDGTLSARKQDGDDSADTATESDADESGIDALFTNRYDAGGSVTLSGRKTVPDMEKTYDARKLEAGMFSFKVIEADEKGNETVVATGTNDANGDITFTTIDYTWDDLGIHNYKIVEDSESKVPGIIYDIVPVEAAVTVSDAGDGTLGTAVTYKKNGTETESAEFVNKTSLTRVEKIDDQGKGLKGAEFSILTKDGKTVTAFISNGEINEIYGLSLETDYILKETKAPEGYMVAKDVSFRLGADGQLYVNGNAADSIRVLDEKVVTDSDKTETKTKTSTNTGDTTGTLLLLMMMGVSFAGIILTSEKKRKRK